MSAEKCKKYKTPDWGFLSITGKSACKNTSGPNSIQNKSVIIFSQNSYRNEGGQFHYHSKSAL